MPLAPSNSVPGKSRAIPLLILAAAGACVFIALAGWLHFSASDQLSGSRDGIEHAQTVLSYLQTEMQRVEHMSESVRLYRLNHDEEDGRDLQSDQIAFSAGALRIAELLGEGQSQTPETRQLAACAAALGKLTSDLSRQGDATLQVLAQCRQTLGTLEEMQRENILKRTGELKIYSRRNDVLSICFTLLSIVVILALFGFLLRDALRRKEYERRLYEANEKLAGTVRALERQAREAALLTAVRDELQLCVKATQAHECAARYLEQLLPGTSGSVSLINHCRHIVETASNWGNSALMMDTSPLEGCCGLRSGRMRWRKPMQSEVDCAHFNGPAPDYYVCIPLAAYGDTLGFVYIECLSAGIAAMVDANMVPLQEMIELVSISIAGLNLRSKLEHQSIRDGLTGLFNRHFMEIALDRELRRASRQNKSVAIVMLDIDHFKQFNDTYGHEAGDTVLRELGAVLQASVRSEDIVCRYGGEEFVAIMPELSLSIALERAESLRRKVGEMRLRLRGESLCEITLSIGVAVYPQHAETLEQVMRAADRALYEAKHLGRNRVISAEAALMV